MGELRSDSNSVIKYFTWKCIPKQNNHYMGNKSRGTHIALIVKCDKTA